MANNEEHGWTAPVDETLDKINRDHTYFDLFEQFPFRAVALWHLNAWHAGFREIQTEDRAALIEDIRECCPTEEDMRRMITEMHKAHDFGSGNKLHSCACCGMRSSNKRFTRRSFFSCWVPQCSIHAGFVRAGKGGSVLHCKLCSKIKSCIGTMFHSAQPSYQSCQEASEQCRRFGHDQEDVDARTSTDTEQTELAHGSIGLPSGRSTHWSTD